MSGFGGGEGAESWGTNGFVGAASESGGDELLDTTLTLGIGVRIESAV